MRKSKQKTIHQQNMECKKNGCNGTPNCAKPKESNGSSVCKGIKRFCRAQRLNRKDSSNSRASSRDSSFSSSSPRHQLDKDSCKKKEARRGRTTRRARKDDHTQVTDKTSETESTEPCESLRKEDSRRMIAQASGESKDPLRSTLLGMMVEMDNIRTQHQTVLLLLAEKDKELRETKALLKVQYEEKEIMHRNLQKLEKRLLPELEDQKKGSIKASEEDIKCDRSDNDSSTQNDNAFLQRQSDSAKSFRWSENSEAQSNLLQALYAREKTIQGYDVLVALLESELEQVLVHCQMAGLRYNPRTQSLEDERKFNESLKRAQMIHLFDKVNATRLFAESSAMEYLKENEWKPYSRSKGGDKEEEGLSQDEFFSTYIERSVRELLIRLKIKTDELLSTKNLLSNMIAFENSKPQCKREIAGTRNKAENQYKPNPMSTGVSPDTPKFVSMSQGSSLPSPASAEPGKGLDAANHVANGEEGNWLELHNRLLQLQNNRGESNFDQVPANDPNNNSNVSVNDRNANCQNGNANECSNINKNCNNSSNGDKLFSQCIMRTANDNDQKERDIATVSDSAQNANRFKGFEPTSFSEEPRIKRGSREDVRLKGEVNKAFRNEDNNGNENEPGVNELNCHLEGMTI